METPVPSDGDRPCHLLGEIHLPKISLSIGSEVSVRSNLHCPTRCGAIRYGHDVPRPPWPIRQLVHGGPPTATVVELGVSSWLIGINPVPVVVRIEPLITVGRLANRPAVRVPLHG